MILTVDNLNLIARVSRGGGGHQSEMHNLTNVIALCPTSDEAGAEYTSLRLEYESLGPQPLSDDWEEQKKELILSQAERAFLVNRKLHHISKIAAGLYQKATGQEPIPLQLAPSPFNLDAGLAPPKVEILPVTLMDYDENKVDEVVVINDELIHSVQCVCHVKGQKRRTQGQGGQDNSQELDAEGSTDEDELREPRDPESRT